MHLTSASTGIYYCQDSSEKI